MKWTLYKPKFKFAFPLKFILSKQANNFLTAPDLLLILFFFLQMTIMPLAQATERREFYNGIRSLGMGGTVAAVVNDETALASNPAGLGRLRNFFGTIIDPEIELGSTAINMYKAQAFSNPYSLSGVAPTAVAAQGDYYHARGQIFPSFVAKNFGIGLLAKYDLDLLANSSTSMETFYRDDIALLLGYNFRFWEGRIKLGFVGKAISRVEVDEAALDPSGSLDLPTLGAAGKAKEGTGVGADVGLVMTAPWTYLPTLAVVVHDVGNTAYTLLPGTRLAAATTRPSTTLQDADVGVSISPIHNNNFRSVWSLEYKGALTASSETDKSKLVHAGFELNFGDVFFLRAGYNQRYWTAGFELSSERFQIQAASYGEEIGTATANREDRRYALKLGFRF